MGDNRFLRRLWYVDVMQDMSESPIGSEIHEIDSENETDSVSSSSLSPYQIIFLFGIVSLFGDMIYEGGRSIIPDYLKFLGASAAIVGIMVGGAEFLGYVIRLVSGGWADRTGKYWSFILVGYLAVITIPLMGLTTNWVIVVGFIIIERLAKGLRSPSRDAVFSSLTKDVGTGKAFGLHEFFDQLGAVLGPAIVVFMMYYTGSYQYTFAALFFPYLFLAMVLFLLYQKTHQRSSRILQQEAKRASEHKEETTSRALFYYTASVFFNTLGLIPVALILYVAAFYYASWQVALIYLLIQGVDALAALVAGWLYDKYGYLALFLVFAASGIPGVLIIYGTSYAILGAAFVFGIIYGAQESIYRARISDIAPMGKRGFAYGVFNVVYGGSMFLAGFFFGLFIDANISLRYAAGFVIIAQGIAISLLGKSRSLK